MRDQFKEKFDFLQKNGCRITEGVVVPGAVYALCDTRLVGAHFYGDTLTIDSIADRVTELRELNGWQNMPMGDFQSLCARYGLVEIAIVSPEKKQQ
jgi:hypothetical protein